MTDEVTDVSRKLACQHMIALGYPRGLKAGDLCGATLNITGSDPWFLTRMVVKDCYYVHEGNAEQIVVDLETQDTAVATFNRLSRNVAPRTGARSTTMWVAEVTYKNPREHEGKSNIWTTKTLTYQS